MDIRTMMVSLCLVLGALVATSQQSYAQTTWEASAAYQLLRSDERTFPVGANGDISRVWGNVGVVAEVGWAMADDESILGVVDFDWHRWNVGVGGRWGLARGGRLRPYGQLLAGVLHTRFSAQLAEPSANPLFGPGDREDRVFTHTGWTLQPGIGIDATLSGDWGVRAQLDYRRLLIDDADDPEPAVDGASDGENQFRLVLGFRRSF